MARGPSPSAEASRRREREAPQPWLEEAEPDERDTHTLVGRRTLFLILLGLALLVAGVIAGILLVSDREASPIAVPRVGEEVPLLTAPGPWKVPPSGEGVEGEPVEGQGQVLFGTGDGRETPAVIDLDALPEEPLPRPVGETEVVAMEPAPAAPAAEPAARAPEAPVRAPVEPVAPRPAQTVEPRPAPKLPVPKVIEAPPPEPARGSQVQLGAFSSESRARAAFKSLGERYAYLAGLNPVIVPVVSDGRTLWRLRAETGSAASARDICGRLKVAGEACTIVD
ncbi:MAG: SPOR domain-containing protein [Sphingomonadaceae bacterium]